MWARLLPPLFTQMAENICNLQLPRLPRGHAQQLGCVADMFWVQWRFRV